MIEKYFSYIAIGLLVIIMIQGSFNKGNDFNEENKMLKGAIDNLTQDKIKLLQKNDSLHDKIYSFEDEILKNDSIIDNSTNEQLDSMFANYFKR